MLSDDRNNNGGDEFTFHDHDKCIEARRPRLSSLFEDYPFHKLIPEPTPPVRPPQILWEDKEFSNKIIPDDVVIFVPRFQDGGTTVTSMERTTLGEYCKRRFGQDAKKTEGET
ncbi:uncharacterized protein LOC143629337 [Bidens hawaiensis]|uniref:uncharacterized protein LOC143629337 n=1 Tax=Bidens hawaiensis TaxID=980011 RepID=UPI00404A565C